MMAAPATALGVTLRVLAESPDASAARAAHEVVVGLPGDANAMADLLADHVPTVLTWEHEHIPVAAFDAAGERGVPARPSLGALRYAQDKIEMRTKMDALGLPNPPWAEVHGADDVAHFLRAHGGEAVLKTARGGYDGKGVRVINSVADAAPWLAALATGGPRLLIEERVDFRRELAVQVARRPSGDVRSWPVVESIQRDGVCAEVIAPAPDLGPRLDEEARRLATTIARQLGVVGVLAVELFEREGRLIINELAMRPHNSGHWTIEGCVTSQFEQHLRAVLDLPLGDTSPVAPWTVMANVLGGERVDLASSLVAVNDPGAKVHLYGKGVRPGRKVGHVTVSGSELASVRARAAAAAAIVADGGVT